MFLAKATQKPSEALRAVISYTKRRTLRCHSACPFNRDFIDRVTVLHLAQKRRCSFFPVADVA
jgi:hypothetical protein